LTRPTDRSHDPARQAWVASAARHPQFPIQNLPWGVAALPTGPALVVAIGDEALVVPEALDAGWGGDFPVALQQALRAATLNALLARPAAEWTQVRLALSDALADPAWAPRLASAMRAQGDCTMHLPMHVGDYTDFYASAHHATNVGSMFRPDNPLLPNYKWVPIGYHGRASSIVVDGTPIRRPQGQTRAPDATVPSVGPSRSLDHELELGLVIGGANALGEPVPAGRAHERLFGVVLLNDWSARDLQAWEYQPLGPFLAKNFGSTISPWVVTADALCPFRVPMPPRPDGDPAPLPYLQVPDDATWSLELAVHLQTAVMAERHEAAWQVSRTSFAEAMYWSPLQLITHHASNGCDLRPGDLLGTGTISGPTPESRGCLLERTWRGAEPLTLPDGTQRRFLEDGDTLILSGQAVREGAVTIGFGACRGTIVPA
jgi:fumarylacetoacetase